MIITMKKAEPNALRIKELCKMKGITMADLAARIGIKPIPLSQSLNNNPTLSRLKEVAAVLEVDVSDLFERSCKEDLYGCLWVNGVPTIIKNRKDLETIIKDEDK